MVKSEDMEVLYASDLSDFPVTAGRTAVTIVDTAEPPTLKSNLPSRSCG
jgi:hypothetical protein